MRLLTNLKAVLFDLDDTLVQTKVTRYQAIIALGERFYNYSISEAMIDQYWGMPHQLFYTSLFKEVDTDVERILKYRSQLCEQFPNAAYQDTTPTIEYLANKYILGMITASGKEMIDSEIAPLHLPLDKFLFIQTSEDTHYHKPDPRVFIPALHTLAGYDISSEQVLYVGDSLKDYQAAKDAGLQFIGIADRTTSGQSFRQAGAQYVTSLSAFTQLV
ncbi:HAD-IA family hydrolase [Rhodocytophaga aerolata]|uniref:phosphoglycolate phosphatase n=1 Tax=Rhodocytophaga aerolata TaxID=455078 RepID=A0ABT8RFF3_9BACT|nr:HAD-IA family hydrolase [Rhodocytophaga aerolata]MDO1450830.1 HAD-IA family hydrolase [Rhodocytophaga aerolata]